MRGKMTGIIALVLLLVMISPVRSQDFNYGELNEKMSRFSVIVDMTIEVSFGMNSTEEQDRMLGTVLTEDGLIMFNGTSLIGEGGMSMHGFSIKTTPTKIEITTMNGDSFDATYLGVDRFTKIGFVRVDADEEKKFEFVKFVQRDDFKVGEWLATFMLLPDFVEPPFAADIGMISTLVDIPEQFPLTVGFSPMQLNSVLFDEKLNPVGAIGLLLDPAAANLDPAGMIESINQYGMPLLGVITADRLEKLIADPPQKGVSDRGWLGISLQALTEDLAEFWKLDADGGIIVNDVIKNSPAESAGLQTGDILLEVNGQAIEVDHEDKVSIFQRSIAEQGPDAKVEIELFRPSESGGEKLKTIVTLAPTPMGASDAPEYENESFEFKVRDMVFADYMVRNLEQDSFFGVVVNEIKPGGLADVAGVQIGDIIQKVDTDEITEIGDLSEVMDSLAQDKPKEVIFFVWRGNKTLFVNLKTDWK